VKQGLSLTEMAAELQRQNDVKVDYLAPSNQIHFVTGSPDHTSIPLGTSELDLMGTEASGLKINDVAHQQIASRLKIPTVFYNRLRGELPTLLDENVNRLLRHNPKPGSDYPKWMVRTLDGTARAVLSDAYRRLDNFEIANAVLPILGDLPGVEIRSCALTDTRMHIKAVTSIEGEVEGSREVGDIVRAGVYVGNSEVGWGSVTVYPFVERLVCKNGMVSQTAGDGMMKRVHLGRRVDADGVGRIFRDATLEADDKAFMLALGDVVRASVDEARFHELVASMSEAAQSGGVSNVQAAVTLLAKNEGLHDNEASQVLQHLAAGGDLSRWGLLNAVTRTAEDSESYDRATDLEQLGGKILRYTPRQWEQLAVATA
jgi:Domain of unknown function (DUF932)